MRDATILGVAVGLVLLVAGAAPGQINQEPKQFEEVGITEHLGAQVPLDLTFTDENGQSVTLGKYFQPGRPVILTLNYYACPMLCTVQLNELVRALKDMPWTPGKEFEIVTVSFNPRETAALARLKKQNYFKEYGRAEAAPGWHFLTGGQQNIQKLTEMVGFRYRWDAESEQYVHGAAAIILTPDGQVSRYLKTIVYDPSTLRLALTEANEGKYRSAVDEVLLYCFHYDAAAGRYTLAATKIMRAGGIVTLLILGGFLVTAWVRGRGVRQPGASADRK
jgi:protein SCO1